MTLLSYPPGVYPQERIPDLLLTLINLCWALVSACLNFLSLVLTWEALTQMVFCPEGSKTVEMAFLAFQTRLVVRTLPSTALNHNRQGTGKDDSATQNQRSENGCHNRNLKCPVCKQGDVVPMDGKQQQKDKKHYL